MKRKGVKLHSAPRKKPNDTWNGNYSIASVETRPVTTTTINNREKEKESKYVINKKRRNNSIDQKSIVS